MRPKRQLSSVVVTLAASVTAVSSQAVPVADNPFSMQALGSGYMLAENTAEQTGGTPPHEGKAQTNDKSSEKKIKEGTCSPEHRKAMEGNCGGGGKAHKK